MKIKNIKFDSGLDSILNDKYSPLNIEIFLIAMRIREIEMTYNYSSENKSDNFLNFLRASENIIDESGLFGNK